MRFEDVRAGLGPAAFASLPGPEAQGAMAPRPRRFWVPGVVPVDARPAAGLALLYPRDGNATLLLTIRAARLAHHRGQVSLPGGAVESGEVIEAAALREAHEEIGLEPAAVRVLGRLTPLHIPVSGYVLNPVVALARSTPAVSPCAGEVERIVEADLGALAGGSILRVEERERDGYTVTVPYFDVGGAKLWGATAMVVAELLALLGSRVDPWR